MVARLILICCFVIVACLASCDPDSQCEMWIIEGHVRDLSGAPIQGATVRADVDAPRPDWWCNAPGCGGALETDAITITDAEGAFVIDVDYSATTALLSAEKPGYRFLCEPMRYYVHSRVGDCVRDCDFSGYGGAFCTIDGFVRDGLGLPIAGVRLLLVGRTAGWCDRDTTDQTGFYAFARVVPGYSYALEPTLEQCEFIPEGLSIFDVTQDLHNQDFTIACGPVYAIDGYVMDSAGQPLSDVEIRYTASGPNADLLVGTVRPDKSGHYLIRAWLANYSYTVTPRKLGWRFEPSSREYRGPAQDFHDQDFVGSPAGPYDIEGYVLTTGGDPVKDVMIRFEYFGPRGSNGSPDGPVQQAAAWPGEAYAGMAGIWAGAASHQVVTDENGFYSIRGNPPGVLCNLTPAKVGCYFSPRSQSVYDAVQDVRVDFTAYCGVGYDVEGFVRYVGGEGAAGITVRLLPSHAGSQETTTDNEGRYAFPGNEPGLGYTVIPVKPAQTCSFDPVSIAIYCLDSDRYNQNFVLTCP